MRVTRQGTLAKVGLLAVALCLGSPSTARAGSFVLETVVGANLGCNGGCLDVVRFGPDQSFAQSQGAGYVGIDSLNDGLTDEAFTYFAQADADFGALSASVTGSYSLTSLDTRFAFASATAIEHMTVNAAGLDGTPGTLNVRFHLDGSASSSGSAMATALVGVQWGVNGPWGLENELFNVYSGPANVNVTVPFTYGTPFYVFSYLLTYVGVPTLDLITFTEVDESGSGTANFFNTLTLTGLQANDASGNVVPYAQFSGASGTPYTSNGVVGVVPEPATLGTLGLGLAAALARLRRIRSRGRG